MQKILILILFFFNTQLFADTLDNLKKEKSFTLGVLVCLSGRCSESGQNTIEAINLAIKEINEKDGILGYQVKTEVEDTREGSSSGKGAVSAFRKLLSNKNIKYFIGPSWTPGGLSVAPIAKKIPNIIISSPSLGVSEFNRASTNIFKTWPSDIIATKFLAEFSIKSNFKKVAIFSSQQPWENLQGKTFEKEFVKLGGTVTTKVEPIPTSSNLRSECLKIKVSKPDAVFLSNYTQMGIGASQLRLSGYKGPLIAILMSDSTLAQSKGALENTIFAGYPKSKDSFIKKYYKEYNKNPGIGADTSYDLIKVYKKAITNANTFNVEAVKKELLKTKLNGASGNISFNEFGGVEKKPILYQIINGKSVLYTKRH